MTRVERKTLIVELDLKLRCLCFFTSSCDYSNADIHASGTITITRRGDSDVVRLLDEINKWVIFKNGTPFTNYINETYNTQKNNAKNIDVTNANV